MGLTNVSKPQSTVLSSTLNKSQQYQDPLGNSEILIPRLLGEKQVCYLCTIQPLPPNLPQLKKPLMQDCWLSRPESNWPSAEEPEQVRRHDPDPPLVLLREVGDVERLLVVLQGDHQLLWRQVRRRFRQKRSLKFFEGREFVDRDNAPTMIFRRPDVSPTSLVA